MRKSWRPGQEGGLSIGQLLNTCDTYDLVLCYDNKSTHNVETVK